ncbi:MAG: SAM-dependent methyltransferase [Methylobacterium sp.]|uniref:protein-L-isoaspartate O-methyltransferase family protein n=1 Tax=Methylobacterium sp. TaxID=409 RepID=UPI000FAF5592|nr:SAM-dependent methyltransferase [Methylobacterium sp.]RUP14229.1 MAG: SAM-dependent methyltransferase [Methylobacterium sp.]
MNQHTDINEVRAFHARLMAVASGSRDHRLERIFESVPREAFLGAGPWKIMVNNRYVETPSVDPVYLYQNILVGLDPAKGINNGEPFLHARWIGAVAPKSGETIVHIGAGVGYYTAILSMLSLPDGSVHAFEIEASLARRALDTLKPFEGVTVIQGDATRLPLPSCDLIYVNAGVVSSPGPWLKALRVGGRIIFPWRPSQQLGAALMMTRTEAGFTVQFLGPAWFIPCVGASDPEGCVTPPSLSQVRTVRAAWLIEDKTPDDTAIAVCRDVWFSDRAG